MSKTVVIIGAGFSGALTAIHLAQLNTTIPLSIHLIDPRGTFGPGLAYSPPSDRFKLNVRAKAMGAFPEDPEGFLRWLKARKPDTSPEDFAPRLWYGEYLSELVVHAATFSGDNKLLRVVDEATDITPSTSAKRFAVKLLSGATIDADACVLAVGNVMQTSLGAGTSPDVFRSPFLESSYEHLSQYSRLLIVGSGLTTVDVILEAEGRRFTGHYTVLSRHGRLPQAHETFATPIHPSLPTGWESSNSIRILFKILRQASQLIGTSQPVFDEIRPKIQAIWNSLPIKEQKRFLRHVRPIWEIHRHRIPLEHAQKLAELRAMGRLELIAGKITSAHRSGQTTSCIIQPPADLPALSTKHFDAAFLCTGLQGDLKCDAPPLLQRLLAQGILSQGPLKLGAHVTPNPSLRTPPHPLWILGSLQREELWEITAVRELREEARTTALAVTSALL